MPGVSSQGEISAVSTPTPAPVARWMSTTDGNDASAVLVAAGHAIEETDAGGVNVVTHAVVKALAARVARGGAARC